VIVERILRDIGEEGDRVAEWWETISRIVRQYIVPYIEELKIDIDEKYLKMIEEEIDFYIRDPLPTPLSRLRYSLSGFSRDVLRIIDILLQAADSKYRAFCNDEGLRDIDLITEWKWRLGNIQIIEWKTKERWIVVGIREIHSGADPEEVFFISNFSGRTRGLIVIGSKENEDSIKNDLEFYGYRYIMRIVDDSIVFLARSYIDFEVLNVERILQTEDWRLEVYKLIQKYSRSVVVALKNKKEELVKIIEENCAQFEIKECRNWIALSYWRDQFKG